MGNKYVDFISDEHLLKCISNLYNSYEKAKSEITRKKFYANKIDTIKLTFDSKFNGLSEEDLIKAEVIRQIDKSINNSIGTFHEQILGGIEGYQIGNLSGFDIKANDNSLFADIKNKHNTMNSSSAEALFQKLKRYADDNKKAKCYWVQILAKGSFNQLWEAEINGKEYKHSRVYKISGDQFYFLLTGKENALKQLFQALPLAIDNFLEQIERDDVEENSIISEIISDTEKSNRTLVDQITFDNYKYYLDFNNF